MKYHIGIFGTQTNVCTLIEKNIIDFFSCKKIKPDIDIWNLFEVAKSNLILNNKYNIIFIEMKDNGKVTSELGKYIRNVLNDKCISIIYFTYADKFDLKIFETHPYYILNVKKGYEQVTRILEELILYDKVSVQNYKYVSNSCINKILYDDILYFESDKKYINIYVKNEDTHRFIGSLKAEKSRLPDNFVFVSQSYIVNIYYIKRMTLENVIMTNGKEIQVGRSFKDEIRKIIKYEKENM